MSKADRQTANDIYHVSEYCKSIQECMLKNQVKWSVPASYMNKQPKLTETNRSALIDWVIEIHYKFNLLPESLFLTVNIIDRYFSKNAIHKSEIQLVGVAAMLIATKYEEIYPPLLKDFSYISDGNCSPEEILEMEKSILFQLDFDL